MPVGVRCYATQFGDPPVAGTARNPGNQFSAAARTLNGGCAAPTSVIVTWNDDCAPARTVTSTRPSGQVDSARHSRW